MKGSILDGKKVSQEILDGLQKEVIDCQARGLRKPGLAAVLVGMNPASQIYVSSKVKTCAKLDYYSEKIELKEDTSQDELLALVKSLNAKEEIDGILVQLPLPKHIDESLILDAISPSKDVDGFHPENMGRLLIDKPFLVPCTPLGIIELLKKYNVELRGRRAVVVGRSHIVGKPMSIMLLKEHATVTICHSRTRDLEKVTSEADILIAAMGKKAFLGFDHIREGAVVVDVGINRVTDEEEVKILYPDDEERLKQVREKGSTLVGDVLPPAMWEKASLYTPVPGGVGPLTIAGLMMNTFKAYREHVGA
ncbi:MAG TPA: bifunctional methylenetetrahydrofolate dehydrogenase/methenyltetrahydrofolate cyclohydrolase FolD [Acidobacteriota bacterium]|nr:bifunctional methylenetetrahydrofolate dehydrogenase/methenyltetrahydrofolate cyclohydrolase FolD [Acidobacteriota bacterium]HNT18691.1 bifunctional methylenetetrahydrofolate dehydrogenase/methenyltetrahydrofolate cyclohydrolase FolD [Acidobacteriota bacterium]HPA27921.1 bifunctional methylenetetrahydrofolate dehydrogenase/methenyltetrahydrofolate cyclohydrolase FolD [Acidobacteriota bacterium]HQO19900.1 bifunctional methylenetetrahydrofolate dehydrogenase/methenyltetrahydrofolate cyclohydrol